jgi:hypothetical protein
MTHRAEIRSQRTPTSYYAPGLGVKSVPVNAVPEMELGSTISNLMPWLILSQFATLGMVMTGDSNEPRLAILHSLASCPHVLRRFDVQPLEKMTSLPLHDIEGVGEVVCPDAGIVEPIILALQRAILYIPESFEQLVGVAVQEKNFVLCWRINVAATPLEECADAKTAETAKRVRAQVLTIIRETLEDLHCTPKGQGRKQARPERSASARREALSRATQPVVTGILGLKSD